MNPKIKNSGLLVLSILLAVGAFTLSEETVPPAIVTPAAAPISTFQSSMPIYPQSEKTLDKNNNITGGTPGVPAKPIQAANLSDGAIRFADRILTKDGRIFPLRQYKPLISPNDTYANQWWLSSNNMSAVWQLPKGSRPTKIAVIDTGFALDHQEFTGRWAASSGESGPAISQNPSRLNCTDQGKPLDKACNLIDDNFDGTVDNESGAAARQNPSQLNCTDQIKPLEKNCNLIDDDGNSLVDDFRGWDFANFDRSASAGETNPDGSGTTHGTMVAGILGATGNNSVGIAGVNWHTQVLPIQALDDDSYGDSYTVGEAIYYAADQGADVISISLGTAGEDPYLRYAIEYALDKGTLVVAASGNDGCDCISYPANYPEVIAVGAIDSTNNPASFSNYGSQLDILAPGASMTTSTWAKANRTAGYAGNVAGTSFATPFVSGLLGLGRSHQPNAAWEEITGTMFENGSRLNLSAAAPRSHQRGYGIVQADTMLERLLSPYQPPLAYRFSSILAGSNRIQPCEVNTLPATRLFELNKSSQRRYTASQFENYKATQQGWISKELFYACIGLPTDAPSLIRTIDLSREIYNLNLKQ